MDLSISEFYMHTQLKISRVLGIWPCTEQTALWKKIIFKIVFYSMLGIKLITLPAVLYHVFDKWGNLPDPFGTGVVLTAHCNTIFGMLYIPIRINKFLALLDAMDQHFIIPTDSTQQHLFDEAMKSASFVTKVFIGSALSTAMSYAVIPFTSYTNGTMTYPLPYQAAFPFDVSQTSGYWTAYFLLAISMMTMSTNASVNCDFIVSMVIKVTCQFRFLQLMIANIKEEAIKRNEQKQQERTKKSQATDGKLSLSELSILRLIDTDKDKTTEGLMHNDEGNHETELHSEVLKRLSECVKFHQVLLQ
ncbi:uncharacterized protein LOC117282350 [Cryptotermes secundus]|uniref:uncharacterized protein LOC117282350 n=1 Tax=Cryptotermes secundus TaxID=105785 RepID=UPI001454CE8B|nr:uncharacterized protein LOC117282350 [Cryptotermes secundus]